MKEKTRIIYVLLAVFAGFLGAHSYYAGNKIKALIQFVCGASVILFPVSYIWALYDVFTHHNDVEENPMRDDYPRLAFWLPLSINILLPVLVLFVYLAITVVPAIAETQKNSERFNCAANLKQIGIAYQMFALDHSGRYPNLEKDFKKLEKYDNRINTYTCQTKKNQPGPYLYIGGYREPVSPKVPVAIERLNNHPGFINILRADGTVDSIPYKERRYFNLAAQFHPDVTKEEFELIKRKFRQFDIPRPQQPTSAEKKAAKPAKPGKK